MAYINCQIAKKIGNLIGKVLEVDVLDDRIGWGSFIGLGLKLIWGKWLPAEEPLISTRIVCGCQSNMRNYQESISIVERLSTVILVVKLLMAVENRVMIGITNMGYGLG